MKRLGINPHFRSMLSPWLSDETARLAVVGVVLVVLTAVGPWLHFRLGGLAHWAVVGGTAAGAAWAASISDEVDQRQALWVIAIAAIAMRLSQLAVTPYLSDDIYRYIWDGRVQAAGINPYRYIPAAPELGAWRDAAIYPLINRADYAPTIYPPVAQMLFLLITRLGESVLVMKAGLVVLEIVAIGATVVLLQRLDLNVTRIAAFAWHPLPVWEIAGSGHVDAGMLGLMMISIVMMLSGRTMMAAVLATAATLVKPLAILVLPVLWRPWNLKLPAVVLATVLLLYAPYLSVGSKVLGFLTGYVEEEELSRGSGFRYVMMAERMFGPMPGAGMVYAAAAAAIMLTLMLAAGFRQDRSSEGAIRSLAVLLTAFLVLLTPHYPWYYLALVPFLSVYPGSFTLWLLTVGGLQTYQAVPGEILPDYSDRQFVFHSLVVLAIARDLWFAHTTRNAERPSATTGELRA